MYRKQVRQRIKGKDVLSFLLKNPDFPSSVHHCLTEIAYCVEKLPNSKRLTEKLVELEQNLSAVDLTSTTTAELHQILDTLQSEFNTLHQHIAQTWFFNNLSS
jgi:uncharacterized alpha-E superfamily protein